MSHIYVLAPGYDPISTAFLITDPKLFTSGSHPEYFVQTYRFFPDIPMLRPHKKLFLGNGIE